MYDTYVYMYCTSRQTRTKIVGIRKLLYTVTFQGLLAVKIVFVKSKLRITNQYMRKLYPIIYSKNGL